MCLTYPVSLFNYLLGSAHYWSPVQTPYAFLGILDLGPCSLPDIYVNVWRHFWLPRGGGLQRHLPSPMKDFPVQNADSWETLQCTSCIKPLVISLSEWSTSASDLHDLPPAFNPFIFLQFTTHFLFVPPNSVLYHAENLSVSQLSILSLTPGALSTTASGPKLLLPC